jgi:hypothetical protein
MEHAPVGSLPFEEMEDAPAVPDDAPLEPEDAPVEPEDVPVVPEDDMSRYISSFFPFSISILSWLSWL